MTPQGGTERSASTAPRLRAGRGSVVPDVEVRTYYDHPVIKRPVWTWEIPAYFLAGGLAGASSVLAVAAKAAGDGRVARAARLTAAAGATVSPVLLISDLGRPERFHHMLRVARPTSPMSMGSWTLAVFGPAAVGAALLTELGWSPPLRRVAGAVAAALAPVMTTYTGVLLSDTAVPVWHDARHQLPWVFAGSSMAAAGAVPTMVLAPSHATTARRVAVLGGAAELVTAWVMERRLGPVGRPYHEGGAGRAARAARAFSGAGVAALALGGRRRAVAVAGGALVVAGSALERGAVFRAGFQSADDPRATVAPQRARLAEREAADVP